MEKDLKSETKKERIMWKVWIKEAELNFEKVKKEREEYGD